MSSAKIEVPLRAPTGATIRPRVVWNFNDLAVKPDTVYIECLLNGDPIGSDEARDFTASGVSDFEFKMPHVKEVVIETRVRMSSWWGPDNGKTVSAAAKVTNTIKEVSNGTLYGDDDTLFNPKNVEKRWEGVKGVIYILIAALAAVLALKFLFFAKGK